MVEGYFFDIGHEFGVEGVNVWHEIVFSWGVVLRGMNPFPLVVSNRSSAAFVFLRRVLVLFVLFVLRLPPFLCLAVGWVDDSLDV